MRMARTAARLFAGIALVPGLALAQSNSAGNYFNNSWFWGASGGAMFFKAGVAQEEKVTAPSVGGEWLVTRTRVGLRLSIEQAFFDKQTAIVDATQSGGVREVDVSDWRRYSAEIYFFPNTNGSIRPYAGMGLALNVIPNTTPTGSYSSEQHMDSVFTAVNEFGTRASTVFTAGVQAGFHRAALFVQGSIMPTGRNFLLPLSKYTGMVQGGVRWNIGNAIEKL